MDKLGLLAFSFHGQVSHDLCIEEKYHHYSLSAGKIEVLYHMKDLGGISPGVASLFV